MDPLQPLMDQVSASVTVEASAVTLINGIAARITAAGTDPTKLAALTTSLNASATALSAAVVANTPAVVPPVVPPPVVTGGRRP